MWGQNTDDTTEDTEDTGEQQTERNGKSILAPVKVLTDMDNKFDDLYNNIIGNLNTYSTYSSKLQSIEVQELSKQLQQKDSTSYKEESPEKVIDDDIKKLLGSVDNDLLGNLGEISVPTERKKRYQFYEEISNINYIAYRMLKVYLDNILIKNVQTKQFLNINSNPNNVAFLQTIKDDIGKHYKNFLKTSVVFFDLQKKLKNKIIPDMLKYGNSFVEILNLDKVSDIASKRELITESYITGNKPRNKITDFGYCLFEADNVASVETSTLETKDNKNSISQQFKNLLINKSNHLEEADTNFYSSIMQDEADYSFDNINDLNFDKLQDIYLKNINPSQVIIIEEDGILYGYLVVESLASNEANEIDIFKRFTQQENSSSTKNSESQIRKEIVDQMTKGVVKKLNETIRNSNASNLESLELTTSIESSIKILLYHKIKEHAKLKFRYLVPDRLINFSTNIDKFGPYGTSIFDPIIQPVKMYTLALMSSIVSRLSRASVVRKWTIEAGNKKNHAEIIEKVKKDISSKSISFDSLSNVKNIAQTITDFRDLATIQVNGQRFIDMEVMPMGDRSLPLNDMNDLRNELIAATGIPSVYLNIGDQVDLRETLVNLNTSFATTISSFQGNIDASLAHLMNSIFNIILENNDYNKNEFLLSNYYSFGLNPPLVLTVQANEALVSSVTNIIGMLKSAEVIIDPEELLKLYIPQVEWESLIKTGEGFIKKQAKDQLMQTVDNGSDDGGGDSY